MPLPAIAAVLARLGLAAAARAGAAQGLRSAAARGAAQASSSAVARGAARSAAQATRAAAPGFRSVAARAASPAVRGAARTSGRQAAPYIAQQATAPRGWAQWMQQAIQRPAARQAADVARRGYEAYTGHAAPRSTSGIAYEALSGGAPRPPSDPNAPSPSLMQDIWATLRGTQQARSQQPPPQSQVAPSSGYAGADPRPAESAAPTPYSPLGGYFQTDTGTAYDTGASFVDLEEQQAATKAAEDRKIADQQAADATETMRGNMRRMAFGLVGATVALVAMPKIISRFGQALVERTRSLAEFGAVQAVEMQILEAERIGRSLDTARETGRSARFQTRGQSELEQTLRPYATLGTNIQNFLWGIGARGTSWAVRIVGHLTGLELIARGMNAMLGATGEEFNPVISFLDELASRPLRTAPGARGRRRLPGDPPGGGSGAADGGGAPTPPTPPADAASPPAARDDPWGEWS